MNNKSRILIIGLDGATFDIIKPMVDSGKLPTFAKLMAEGGWGNLKSTILPVTPPAWTSFMTGKNPGKHGVFGFFTNKTDSYETEFTTRLSIKAKTIWNYLDGDKRVCLIDIPLTFPPQKINGYMISGMPVPSETSIFTYPPELHTELIREIGDYMIDSKLMKMTGGSPIEALKHLYIYTEMRMSAVRYFLKKKGPFDFFMVVFRGTDFVEHAAFKFLDKEYAEKNPEENSKYGKTIFQFYEKIDSYLSEIQHLMGDDCTLIIMSDHGLGPLKKLFYINRWLKQEGFLKLKKYIAIRKKGLKLKSKNIEALLDRLGVSFMKSFLPEFLRKLKFYYFLPYEKHPSCLINWQKTKAYANLTWTDGVIKVNLRDREPDGGVDEIDYERVCTELIEKLKNIVDPDTGRKVMEAVYRRDEIYSGPYVKDAPDVIALTRDINYAYRVTIYGDELFETPVDPVPATHRMNGIFMIKGPNINEGVNLPLNDIVDIAPTILYLMGYKIPEEMDGKVIVNAIDEGFLRLNPVVFSKDKTERDRLNGDVEFNEKDRLEIEESLRSLGYLT